MADTPRTTSVDSPDTLPRKYTNDQLAAYIRRQLGEPTWVVELTNQQVLDTINDALEEFSIWVPATKVLQFQLVKGQFSYAINEGSVSVATTNRESIIREGFGQGVSRVWFVEPNPVPTEIFYGNLINPAPLFRVGMDEYDTFLRWRKTWQRVTSIAPDWFFDEPNQQLLIHNPIERYSAAVEFFGNYTNTFALSPTGSNWVKKYALESSRFLYGEILSKYSGAIPAPAKDMQLDTAKREKAQERLDKLRDELKGMQTLTPIQID